MRKFQAKLDEKIKTHILHSVTFISENRVVYEIYKNMYVRARQATDEYNTTQKGCKNADAQSHNIRLFYTQYTH